MDCKNVLTLQKQKITNVDLSLNLFFLSKICWQVQDISYVVIKSLTTYWNLKSYCKALFVCLCAYVLKHKNAVVWNSHNLLLTVPS